MCTTIQRNCQSILVTGGGHWAYHRRIRRRASDLGEIYAHGTLDARRQHAQAQASGGDQQELSSGQTMGDIDPDQSQFQSSIHHQRFHTRPNPASRKIRTCSSCSDDLSLSALPPSGFVT